jgi:hypothetical protein
MAVLIRSFSPAGALPPIQIKSSLQPWNAIAYSKSRLMAVFSFGNDSSLMSVEVMCHRSKAPPPADVRQPHQPSGGLVAACKADQPLARRRGWGAPRCIRSPGVAFPTVLWQKSV